MEIKLIPVFLFPITNWVKRKLLLHIMRTVVFLFCLSVFSITPNNVLSQNVKIVIEKDKTVTVDEVFDLIMGQTDYTFIYQVDMFDDFPKVSLSKGTILANKLLKQSLSNDNINFEFTNNNTIVIKELPISQQELTISGKITDVNNVPLGGAIVINQTTWEGLAADFDGNYGIKAKVGDKLLFQYLGFTSQEITVESNAKIDVQLVESFYSLDQVTVVSTGYQTISKERATGSYETIGEKEIALQVTPNIIDRLEGISTGLAATVSNGSGGNSTRLTLRGLGTFNAESQPLIVVDGFPIEGGLETVNPNDIATLTILKDAAAASIWGVQAGNGVIVITTKTGKPGKAVVEFSTFATIESKPRLNDFQIAPSSAMVDLQSYRINSGIDRNYSNVAGGTGIASLDAVGLAWLDFDNGTINETQRDARLNVLRNTNNFSQFEDLLMRDAFIKQHNLSVKGGSENNRYYASITFNDNQSVMTGDDDDRVAINLKNDLDITNKLKLNLGINTIFSSSNFNSEGIGLVSGRSGGLNWIPSYQNLLDGNGNRLNIPRDHLLSVKSQYEDLGYLDWSYNPLDELESRDFTTKGLNLRLQARLSWQILPELSMAFSGMYERGQNNSRNHSSLETYKARNTVNEFTIVDPATGEFTYQVPRGGILDERDTNSDSYTVRTQFNFDKTINTKHEINAIAGVEARQIKTDVNSRTLLGYNDKLQVFDKRINWESLSGFLRDFSGARVPGYNDPSFVSVDRNRFISFFANSSYTFDNRYTLSLSGKIEQASIFGVDARLRANQLGSVGFAWNIANEDFFKSEVINNLKLRGSYGINGNVKRGITTESVFRADLSPYGEPILDISVVGNDNLTQEDNYIANIGLDFAMFKYRLNGSIDYYNRRSENLLADFRTPAALGYTSQFVNNGEILNQGIELSLNGDILRAGDFYWNSQLNFTYNKSEVIKFQTSTETAAEILSSPFIQGEEIGALLSYNWAGLSEDGQPQVFDANGDIVGFETNILDVNALVNSGSSVPNYFGGFRNTFNYKNFSLGVFLTYKFGHKFRRPSFNFQDPGFSSLSRHQDLTNVWQEAGDESITNVARFPTREEFENGLFGNWNNYYRFSNVLIEDASFIRIRDIYINYKLSNNALKKLPFDNLEIRFQARNLGFLWLANNYDIDPDVLPLSGGVFEANSSEFNLNVSRPGYRLMPQFTLGFNIQF